MSSSFNVDEIFEIAEEIERNGARFYRQAAENASAQDVRLTLLDFARMEDKHERIFAAMREQLADGSDAIPYDPDHEAVMYLRTMAAGRGMEGKKGPTQPVTGEESVEEIINIAINAEKTSIAYYTGLKELVSPEDRPRIDAVIQEEMGHLARLNEYLANLARG